MACSYRQLWVCRSEMAQEVLSTQGPWGTAEVQSSWSSTSLLLVSAGWSKGEQDGRCAEPSMTGIQCGGRVTYPCRGSAGDCPTQQRARGEPRTQASTAVPPAFLLCSAADSPWRSGSNPPPSSHTASGSFGAPRILTAYVALMETERESNSVPSSHSAV